MMVRDNPRQQAKDRMKKGEPVVIRIRGRSYVCRSIKDWDKYIQFKIKNIEP